MKGRFSQIFRLLVAARTLAPYEFLLGEAQRNELPASVRWLLRLLRVGRGSGPTDGGSLSEALASLGPSYIKLGQFLATRSDIVGEDLARDLMRLQDRLPPFPREQALAEIRLSFGVDADKIFRQFDEPVAAASIAQVHRARTSDDRDVAVKVLRPRIEQKFAEDLAGFFFAARALERIYVPSRRLRPVNVVETLARSVELEMDLRMEAAAISEMESNIKNDRGFRVPQIDWTRTARRVLTTEWIDGYALSDFGALWPANIDPKGIAEIIVQSFLRHAIRDGFFHADMHPGNLFVDRQSNVVAVDFGIMGRLNPKERRFLAEILFGFINKDYVRVSDVHFDAGYVSPDQSRAMFAQALRAIGEPLMDKTANDISMARLLTQLFQVTGLFNMETQPQLLLLQKTMVVVEGVARTLNPNLNMWSTAEPVVREWIEAKLGPQGRIEEAAEGAALIGKLVGTFPEVLSEAQMATHMLSEMAQSGGLRLDRQTTEAIARAQVRQNFPARTALWLGALVLAILALIHVF